jgi:hypothetical protein
VDHIIDIDGGKAYTNITGSHFREAGVTYAGIPSSDALCQGYRDNLNSYA